MAEKGSISRRLLVASAIALPVFLGLTGFGLDRSFRIALLESEREQLKIQSYLLLGAADLTGGAIRLPEALPEPRFNQLGSGLYARVTRPGGDGSNDDRVDWTSASAELIDLPAAAEPVPTGDCTLEDVRAAGLVGPGGARATPLFRYQCGLVWEDARGREQPFQLAIFHEQAPYLAQVIAFRTRLFGWMALAGGVLIALQLAVLRFGLRPLGRLIADLGRVQAGAQERLAGAYPREIHGVTESLNALLAAEEGRRERYRQTLADLAHSLKTPLAVLRTSLDTNRPPDELRSAVDEQVERMSEIVAHQLGRAASPGARPLGRRTPVAPAATRLGTALEKIYLDRSTKIAVEVPDDLVFHGDEADLMEMLGNLLDNACKYGRGRVAVRAEAIDEGIRIDVLDDGPGISAERRADVVRRGVRADEHAPGQGLGLAVAVEIARANGGRVEIAEEPSALGGARVALTLPGSAG